MKPLLGTGALLLLGGCLTPSVESKVPHLYPVCYFESAPAPETVQANLPRLREVLQGSLASRRPVEIASSPDGRWLVANVTPAQNMAAASVWPRVGCIGNAIDSASTKKEADCVAFVKDFTANRNYFAFGNARDVVEFDIWHESSVTTSPVYCKAMQVASQPASTPLLEP